MLIHARRRVVNLIAFDRLENRFAMLRFTRSACFGAEKLGLRSGFGLVRALVRPKVFAMLPSSWKMSELAAYLGIHRVSFARLARQNGIPGLVRTPSGRWRLSNRSAFEKFAERYKLEGEARCKLISDFQRERERELKFTIRFHRERFPNDGRIPTDCEEELRRIKSVQGGGSYTTTEVAERLGVTSQTVRNWRKKIPGAMLVGQRLRFAKSEKLEAYLVRRRRRRARSNKDQF
jgi:excisionase family DNA binding protein